MSSDEKDGESMMRVRDCIFKFERASDPNFSNSLSKFSNVYSPDSSLKNQSPFKSPKKPSYLSVSCSNNGYNDSLIYSNEFRNFENSPKLKANGFNGHANSSANYVGSDHKVSLGQILAPRQLSKYQQSRLSPVPNIPEQNCASFMKNIHSFEKIAKSGQALEFTQEPKTNTTGHQEWTTMICQKIEHLMHPEPHPSVPAPQSVAEIYRTEKTLQIGADIKEPVKMENFCDAVTKILKSFELRQEDDADHTNKDGRYFLQLVKNEEKRLLALSDLANAELEMDQNLPEDISGKLRAASGKARLLVGQKMKQFEGLCEQNLNPAANVEVQTKSDDLAGFWDMVLIQIHSIYSIFLEIRDLKNNNWQPITTVTPSKKSTKGLSKSVTKTPAANQNIVSEKAIALRKDRENTRRKMMEEKRRRKELMEKGNTDTEVDTALNVHIFSK